MTTPSSPSVDVGKTTSGGVAEGAALKERYQRIAEVAYLRSEKRGFVPGYELADWLEAESEIGEGAVVDGDTQHGIRKLVAGNPRDLKEKVRLAALRALAAGGLDRNAVRGIVLDIVKGAEQGAAHMGENGQKALKESVKGLEEALSDLTTAAELAIQKAHGRTADYSQNELRHAVDELQALKSLFGDTLETAAVDMSAFAQAALHDLSGHAHGEAKKFSGKLEETLKRLSNHLRASAEQHVEVGKKVLQEQGVALSYLTATSLKEIAKRLEDRLPKDKP